MILIIVITIEVVCLLHMHLHMALWRTVQVVTAKDLMHLCAIEQHVDITTNE